MKLKFKIDYNLFVLFLISIITIYANYWLLLPKFKITGDTVRAVWAVALVLPLIISALKIKLISAHYFWLAYLFFVLIRNAQLAKGDYVFTLNTVLCILAFFVCTFRCEWVKKVPLIIFIVGLPNLIATLLFYVNNSYYKTFIKATYKTFQAGTEEGKFGFRAGIAGHYSHNGTYLAILLLVLFTILISVKLRGMRKAVTIAAAAAALFALFLTTKRAHLIFSGAAILVTYYIANRGSGSKKLMRTVIIAAVLIMSFELIVEAIPALSNSIDRLSASGEDNASVNRFTMWDYAMRHFWEKPVFGHSWYSFGYERAIAWVDGANSGAHNVYVQLLFEVGAAGFIVAVATLVVTLITTARSVVALKKANSEYLFAAALSLAVQIFFILYGFTGNFLYDQMFMFYAVAVAAGLGISANLKTLLSGTESRLLKGGAYERKI